MLVSIIIPIYNGEKYLKKLFYSIENQIYKDFEVIFINDGSTDSTLNTLSVLSNNSKLNITVLSQENKGVSAARNLGLLHSSSDYICFVDCDDSISPYYLQLLVNAVQNDNVDTAVGYMTRNSLDLDDHGNKTIVMDIDAFLHDYLFFGSKYQLPTAIFSRSMLKMLNISFAEGEKYGEDVHFTWRVYAAQKKMIVIPYKIYCYNDVPSSATNTLNLERKNAIKLFNDLSKYIKDVRPTFSHEFDKYAVARQYWSLLWKAATVFKTYNDFEKYINNFEMKKNIKKLLFAPDFKVIALSSLFIISKTLYYQIINRLMDRKST